MKYITTKTPGASYGLSYALAKGLADDGGLFVPQQVPRVVVDPQPKTHLEISKDLLRPFMSGDPLLDELDDICHSAFNFPVPLVQVDESTAVLELFHGPSAAFKDFGARFLANCFSKMNTGKDRPVTILVATSGDTGGAVASAFWRLPNTQVFVLYPKGKVSTRQEHQLTCWGDNVRSFAVTGVFDDCQRMVKQAFNDPGWNKRFSLSSANSINIGRLLPQMTYYASSSLEYLDKHGEAPGYVIPSGNLGNAMACIWAREMGYPIREIVFAANANRPIVDWVKSGAYKAQETISTLANAMDVGAPSNMERLLQLYPQAPSFLSAVSVSDDEIKTAIREGESRYGQVFCPHTACAMAARETKKSPHWVVVGTADPSKFEGIVEPLIGRTLAVPEPLAALLKRPTVVDDVESLDDIAKLVSA